MSKSIPKYKCGYRLCNNSVWGKRKRKFCTPQHATQEAYLAKHPEARGNKLLAAGPVKSGRPRIKARRCEYPRCQTNIDHRPKSARFCDLSNHTSSTAKIRLKTINKQKKTKFYADHGIKFDKTVRNRDAPATASGLPYTGQTLLYEHYKEPLKPIEKGKGYGYYGTVALTSDKEYVQCHICGNLYPNVGAHLRKHKITAEKYKEVYQLSATTALISEPVRRMYQEKVVSKLKGNGLPEWLKEYNQKVQTGEVKHPGTKRKGISLEKRNELGLCPDQVLEKIKDLADKLGKTPGLDDFKREYGGRYIGSITFQHGSWTAAVKKAGMITREELRRPDSNQLLSELQEFFHQYGRIPMTSDFNRGMLRDRGVYIRVFGTLNNARIEAGLNAVLPMPFGQTVELTPEQYHEYRAGRGLSMDALRARKRRAKKKEIAYDR